MAQRSRRRRDKLDKEAPTLSEAERTQRQRELVDLDQDFQRKQREFQEDLNQRKNEELQRSLERANKVIKQIAERKSTTSSCRKRSGPARASTSPTR